MALKRHDQRRTQHDRVKLEVLYRSGYPDDQLQKLQLTTINFCVCASRSPGRPVHFFQNKLMAQLIMNHYGHLLRMKIPRTETRSCTESWPVTLLKKMIYFRRTCHSWVVQNPELTWILSFVKSRYNPNYALYAQLKNDSIFQLVMSFLSCAESCIRFINIECHSRKSSQHYNRKSYSPQQNSMQVSVASPLNPFSKLQVIWYMSLSIWAAMPNRISFTRSWWTISRILRIKTRARLLNREHTSVTINLPLFRGVRFYHTCKWQTNTYLNSL